MESGDYLETQDLCSDEPAMSASSFGKQDKQVKRPSSSGITCRRKKTGIAEEERQLFLMLEVVSPVCLLVDHMFGAHAQMLHYCINSWHAESVRVVVYFLRL